MAYPPQTVLAAVRDGQPLNPKALHEFVCGMADGRTTESHMAAFAMAVRLKGLNARDTTALTLAMRDSGERLTRAHLGVDAPLIDKHSTGGVGDAVSLLLAPMLAACGAAVPMISGRGLGFTGGTLDKLSALAGYQAQVAPEQLRRCLQEAGCAIIGAGANWAPADRQLYAVRDVTATVDATPLIVASILSKKLAVALDALVLDVKCGSGAWCQSEAEARELAEALVRVATEAELPCSAFITDMNQPLLPAIGNATELNLVLDLLHGVGTAPRFVELCLTLGSFLLTRVGLASSEPEARRALREALDSGEALVRFIKMARCLGTDADLDRARWRAPLAPVSLPLRADQDGCLERMDARRLGELVVQLGGGRLRASDSIDPSVGFSQIRALGDHLEVGSPILMVHARNLESASWALAEARQAIRIGSAIAPLPLVLGRVQA
ncbi:thymidine phosphorylase [Ahniella affigens]|uniref:thymidine phosphorylase n=1 Tax=Ahniella affigens TaxID=2021234 RepID=A0A2P1PVT1_9GAMM|nr:thymidine phosphorylase [Ahniella affigens]AVP98949.1 thymidine phosphorylase [Ahniella affigens]